MRKAGSVGTVTRKRIWDAAINLMAEHGFDAVSMRDLARVVGIQAASLYGYVSSKQHLLFDIMERGQKELLRRLSAEVLCQPNATAQLRSFVRLHIEFFLSRPNEVRLIYWGLGSLTPLNRKKLVALRDEYDQGLKDILAAGCSRGDFEVDDIALAEKVIINMLSGALTWYRPDGRLSHEQLIRYYTEMVFRLVEPRVIRSPARSKSARRVKR
jgi:AcrR family transcriptional regulator